MSFRWFNKRPSGSTPNDLWAQSVEDRLNSLRPVNSPTVQIARWDNKGVQWQAAPQGISGSTLIQAVITTLFYGTDDDGDTYDYMGVTPYDAPSDSLTGSEILCAKSVTAWSPASEAIDGTIITYVYSGDNPRVASSTAGANENQVMHPRYYGYGTMESGQPVATRQALVYITRVARSALMTATDDDHAGQPIYYLEVQPCRYWSLVNSVTT